MTVAASYGPVQFTGDGTTRAFPFAYPFFAASDLVVTLFNTSTDTAVTPAPVLNGSGTYDYTVTGTQDIATGEYLSGGTVTCNNAPASMTITIARDVAATQNTALVNNGPFPAKAIEAGLDRLTMLAQQAAAIAAGMVHTPIGDPPGLNMTLPLASSRADQFLMFDGAGNATVTTLPDGSARAGQYLAFDGAGNPTAIPLTSADVPISASWLITPQTYGAKFDGVTDDTAAWVSALAVADTTGCAIFHSGGNSIVTGNLALNNQTIMGVGSYSAPPGGAITQDSLITFVGNDAGLTLKSATSGGFTLMNIGFKGTPASYSGQTGLLLSDSLRTGLNEGWPTLWNTSFGGFNEGIQIGQKYQTGYMFNVYCYDSVYIGYQNQSTDWYHHGVYCGSSSVVASGAQLYLGSDSPSSYSSGAHQFHGGAFFGGNNSVLIKNSFGNYFAGAAIQNANGSGALIIGDNHTFIGCLFSGNNANGGTRNAAGTWHYDIEIEANSKSITVIGCSFAQNGAGSTCVATPIVLGGSNFGFTATGNQFFMDNVVTPGEPTAPQTFALNGTIIASQLDSLNIWGNNALYGIDGKYPFNVLPVDMASVVNPYSTASAEISIRAGTAYISAAVALLLANPSYAGRALRVAGVSGASFSCATSGALGSSHTSVTFGSGGGYVELVSTGATTWQICGSSGATLS
jgi:hypothetical protein